MAPSPVQALFAPEYRRFLKRLRAARRAAIVDLLGFAKLYRALARRHFRFSKAQTPGSLGTSSGH